jgi:hypothetical protein
MSSLTEGKDLVASTRNEILPSFVGQDDMLIEGDLTASLHALYFLYTAQNGCLPLFNL